MQQISTKNSIRLETTGWGNDPLGIVQESEIWPDEQNPGNVGVKYS